jgi:1,4-alpha-glucan branching enzyme
VQDLNGLYRSQPAMWELDPVPQGFEWIDCNDWEQSIVAVMRRGKTPGDEVVAVLNFTPVVRYDYRIGVPRAGTWTEILNSDSAIYGGSGVGNMGEVTAVEEPHHGRMASMSVAVPPLGAVFFRNFQPVPDDEKGPFGPGEEGSKDGSGPAKRRGRKK